MLTTRDKSHWFHKFALKTLLQHPKHLASMKLENIKKAGISAEVKPHPMKLPCGGDNETKADNLFDLEENDFEDLETFGIEPSLKISPQKLKSPEKILTPTSATFIPKTEEEIFGVPPTEGGADLDTFGTGFSSRSFYKKQHFVKASNLKGAHTLCEKQKDASDKIDLEECLAIQQPIPKVGDVSSQLQSTEGASAIQQVEGQTKTNQSVEKTQQIAVPTVSSDRGDDKDKAQLVIEPNNEIQGQNTEIENINTSSSSGRKEEKLELQRKEVDTDNLEENVKNGEAVATELLSSSEVLNNWDSLQPKLNEENKDEIPNLNQEISEECEVVNEKKDVSKLDDADDEKTNCLQIDMPTSNPPGMDVNDLSPRRRSLRPRATKSTATKKRNVRNVSGDSSVGSPEEKMDVSEPGNPEDAGCTDAESEHCLDEKVKETLPVRRSSRSKQVQQRCKLKSSGKVIESKEKESGELSVDTSLGGLEVSDNVSKSDHLEEAISPQSSATASVYSDSDGKEPLPVRRSTRSKNRPLKYKEPLIDCRTTSKRKGAKIKSETGTNPKDENLFVETRIFGSGKQAKAILSPSSQSDDDDSKLVIAMNESESEKTCPSDLSQENISTKITANKRLLKSTRRLSGAKAKACKDLGSSSTNLELQGNSKDEEGTEGKFGENTDIELDGDDGSVQHSSRKKRADDQKDTTEPPTKR